MTAVPGGSGVSGSTPKIGIRVWLSDHRSPFHKSLGAPEIAESVAFEFNQAHPDYLVDIESRHFHTLPGEVLRAAEQGDPPDIAEFDFTATRAALDAIGHDGTPLFTPIEQAIAGRTEILGEPVVLGDMLPAARDYFRYAGDVVAIPRSATTVVLYANMNILAKAGVTEPPRTWREVTSACRAIANLRGGPAYGITWPNDQWLFMQSVAQQGGLIVDRDNGRSGRPEKIDIASSEMLAYVTWWQRLHQQGHYLYTGKIQDFGGCAAAFEDQQVALVLSSSADVTRLMQNGERQGFNVQASRMPYNDEVQLAGNSVGDHPLWLAAGLSQAKQDGALAFIQRLINPQYAAVWAKLQTRIPITRAGAAVLDREGWFRRNPDFCVASDQLDAADGSPAALGPLLGGYGGIADEITGAMHNILTGESTVVAGFTSANARAQEILDAYNSYCAGPPRRSPRDLSVYQPRIRGQQPV
jgi:sn-glycerol 3-phosphate transport system substrate-binding protein